MTLDDLWRALALMAVLEGLFYAALPGLARRMIGQILQLPTDWLRLSGLTVAALGVASLWLLRG